MWAHGVPEFVMTSVHSYDEDRDRPWHYNRLISRRRAAVETTFATLKRRMGLTSIRYIGLTKASAQVLFAAIAFNMRRWVALAPA